MEILTSPDFSTTNPKLERSNLEDNHQKIQANYSYTYTQGANTRNIKHKDINQLEKLNIVCLRVIRIKRPYLRKPSVRKRNKRTFEKPEEEERGREALSGREREETRNREKASRSDRSFRLLQRNAKAFVNCDPSRSIRGSNLFPLRRRLQSKTFSWAHLQSRPSYGKDNKTTTLAM